MRNIRIIQNIEGGLSNQKPTISKRAAANRRGNETEIL